MGRARLKPRPRVQTAKAMDSTSIIDGGSSEIDSHNTIMISRNQLDLETQLVNCEPNRNQENIIQSSSIVGEIISCDSGKKRPKQRGTSSWKRMNSNHENNSTINTNHRGKQSTIDNQHHLYYLYNYYSRILKDKLSWKPTTDNNKSMEPSTNNNDTNTLHRMHQIGSKLPTRARRLNRVRFPFQVAHHDGLKLAPEQWNSGNDDLDLSKDFLNKRQFKLTCLTLALLAFAAACSPMEADAFVAPQQQHQQQQEQQTNPKNPAIVVGSAAANDDANRNTRSLSSYDFKDWLPGSQQHQPVTVLSDNQLGLGSPPTIDPQTAAEPSADSIATTVGDSNAAVAAAPTTTSGSAPAETQLMAPMGSSSAPDHMLTAASKKKKKKMKMMKKKKKMEKKHKEWKKGKKHKKKKYESKKKKGGSSKKKKGKKEKKKWGMEKKGHKKKGNFKKKKWGSKKKMKKGHKKGKKGHKLLKDKGHKKKGFKKVYHKEEWGKKKKWHDIKREKKWNTKAKKWKKKWHQEKGKKYKGKHMKKYHKKNKHGKKYKKEKKSKWKKHKGEKFKKGHKKKKEEYSKKKEGGKKKKMKKMKKEMKKKKKG